MAKINVNGGHCPKAPGAHGYLDELTEDRLIKDELIRQLKLRGHSVSDSTSNASSQNEDLKHQVTVANASGATLAVSIHLNAGGGTGPEVFHYAGDGVGANYASKISYNLAKILGLRNRGAKGTTGLYFINNTNMTAVLVEVCFVDTKADADAYRRVGYKRVAAAIADAICDTNNGVMGGGEWVKDAKGWWWKNSDGSWPSNEWKYINGNWYWFKPDGYMATGWVLNGTTWYWCHDSGAMIYSACRQINGAWYAFGPSGAMLTNCISLSDKGALKLG